LASLSGSLLLLKKIQRITSKTSQICCGKTKNIPPVKKRANITDYVLIYPHENGVVTNVLKKTAIERERERERIAVIDIKRAISEVP